jgi:hypothetical protein
VFPLGELVKGEVTPALCARPRAKSWASTRASCITRSGSDRV